MVKLIVILIIVFNVALAQDNNPFKERAKELCTRLDEYEPFFKKTISDAKYCFENEVDNYKCKPKFFFNVESQRSSVEMCNLFTGRQKQIDECRKLHKAEEYNKFELYIFNNILEVFFPPSKFPFNKERYCVYYNFTEKDQDFYKYKSHKNHNQNEVKSYRGGLILYVTKSKKDNEAESNWTDGVSFLIAHKVEANGRFLTKSVTEPKDTVLIKIWFGNEIAHY